MIILYIRCVAVAINTPRYYLFITFSELILNLGLLNASCELLIGLRKKEHILVYVLQNFITN